MERMLHALGLATLVFLAGCGGQESVGLTGAEAGPATERAELQSHTAAVCAPSPEPCEDVFLSELDGSCTTNLGRDCIEAKADQALRRWVADPQAGPEGGGDTHLLEILDEHTIVVGYAFGSDRTFTGVQVEDGEDRITVVLMFAEASKTTDDGQPVFFTAELRTDREIVTVPTAIGRRPIEISVQTTASS